MIYLCWLFFKQRSIIKPNLIFSFKVMKLKLLIVALFCSVASWGQVSITGLGAGNTYSQNFNTATATVPTGWAFSESGTGANGAFTTGTGTATGGDTYFFGVTNEWASVRFRNPNNWSFIYKQYRFYYCIP